MLGSQYGVKPFTGNKLWLYWHSRSQTPSSSKTVSACSACCDPISTDMEQGNTRQRPRPGDNVGTVTQPVRFYAADYDTFVEWVKTTLNLGTARFTIDVWLGTSLANKVCQFTKPGTNLVASWPNPDLVDVRMTLRIAMPTHMKRCSRPCLLSAQRADLLHARALAVVIRPAGASCRQRRRRYGLWARGRSAAQRRRDSDLYSVSF
ncbi:hypothetical protein ACVWZM_004778 [Bradyrhizobium sp. USDA 4501]